jgi:hypothetical protein
MSASRPKQALGGGGGTSPGGTLRGNKTVNYLRWRSLTQLESKS